MMMMIARCAFHLRYYLFLRNLALIRVNCVVAAAAAAETSCNGITKVFMLRIPRLLSIAWTEGRRHKTTSTTSTSIDLKSAVSHATYRTVYARQCGLASTRSQIIDVSSILRSYVQLRPPSLARGRACGFISKKINKALLIG